jgi:uncharacterized protein (TIGR03435 family)
MRIWSYTWAPFVIAAIAIAAAAQQADPAKNAQFEAASVKPIEAREGTHSLSTADPGRLKLAGTMHVFILHAYGITKDQLGGEPPWFKTQLYSIEAVTNPPVPEDQMNPMLRNLLADRFQLKLREEQRELPVFLLQVDRGGPKFSKATRDEEPPEKKTPSGVVARSFNSVQGLVRALNGYSGGAFALDRIVIDQTNLTGRYHMQIVTEIEPQTEDGRPPQYPNLLHDLQSQLGLKLVASRAKLPFFTVEHSAQPGPN